MISFSVSDEIIVVIYGSHQELTIKISPISSKLDENVIYFRHILSNQRSLFYYQDD